MNPVIPSGVAPRGAKPCAGFGGSASRAVPFPSLTSLDLGVRVPKHVRCGHPAEEGLRLLAGNFPVLGADVQRQCPRDWLARLCAHRQREKGCSAIEIRAT